MNAIDSRATHPSPVVEAELEFLIPQAEKPRSYAYDPPDGAPRTNARYEVRRVGIADVRPRAGALSLDREGFVPIHAPSALRDFADEAAIRRLYYPEAASLVRALTGASRVHVFDHTLRRRIDATEDRARGVPRQPATRVHVDQTERSGPARLRFELPDEAQALLRERVRIINLWRPIGAPAWDRPLALCDARSVDPGDLVAADLVFPDRTGETYAVLHNPGQRWSYVPGLAPEEALLIKCYDSVTDGRARFVPHSAFVDPTAPADAPPRQSIELRLLVFGG